MKIKFEPASGHWECPSAMDEWGGGPWKWPVKGNEYIHVMRLLKLLCTGRLK